MSNNWIHSRGKRGMYKEEIKVRVPRVVRQMMEKRATQKGMSLSEYLRFLVHKDLEGEYGETLSTLGR
jgi:predicted DNA binding CopG/RHH family protein